MNNLTESDVMRMFVRRGGAALKYAAMEILSVTNGDWPANGMCRQLSNMLREAELPYDMETVRRLVSNEALRLCAYL
jgi:hypothetical protein